MTPNEKPYFVLFFISITITFIVNTLCNDKDEYGWRLFNALAALTSATLIVVIYSIFCENFI